MNAKRLLFSGFLFISGIICAQTDFRPGFIITNDQDTVYGNVDYRGDELMGTLCRFRTDGKTITEYYPGDIEAYGFVEGKFYVARLLETKKAFLEYLISGQADIFYLRDETGDHYYIEKSGMPLAEIPYKEEMRYVNSTPYLYASKTHIGLLSLYMQDAPDFQSEIANIGKPEHKNLIKLAEDYHKVVCKDKACIVYEKKMPLLSWTIEPFWGLIKYAGIDDLFNEIGCYTSIASPRNNEKISVKTGVGYHRIKGDSVNLDIFKMPLQLQYIYPGKRLQPRIGLGVNLFFTDLDGKFDFWTHTFALNAGLNYRIADKLYVFGLFNSDFTPAYQWILEDESEFGKVGYGMSFGLSLKL
jgi:hypothetical protein